LEASWKPPGAQEASFWEPPETLLGPPGSLLESPRSLLKPPGNLREPPGTLLELPGSLLEFPGSLLEPKNLGGMLRELYFLQGKTKM
jgi:hypothetical protein